MSQRRTECGQASAPNREDSAKHHEASRVNNASPDSSRRVASHLLQVQDEGRRTTPEKAAVERQRLDVANREVSGS